MTSRNTLLFGAALAAATAAIAIDHATHPVPPRPGYGAGPVAAGTAPCAAAPCAAGAPKLAAPPPPLQPGADDEGGSLAAPPPPPKARTSGEETPDLAVGNDP